MENASKKHGRLSWKVPALKDVEHLEEHATSSPAPQAPEFLKDLPKVSELYEPKQPITRKLKTLIEEHAYGGAFEAAIEAVSHLRVPTMRKIKTLYQFYYYIDELVTWRPCLRVWDWQGEVFHERTDYLRITQFYFYFNQPELVALQSPIDPVMGLKLTPISLWLREFAVDWGSFLDTRESAKYIKSYLYAPEYSFQDYNGGKNGYENYKTFNDWFSRTFKNIDVQRPVAQPDDPRIIAFPAESTYVGQWTINTAVKEPKEMKADSSIVVKHVEWPIPTLLQNSKYADEFEGGILVHSFLNVFDYHRQHAPASGKILEAKFIPGQVYLEVDLENLDAEGQANENAALANAYMPHRYLDAQDNTGYQFVQCRGLFVLETAIGKIAILPMGMAHVSSVAFVSPGTDQLIRLSAEERKNLSYDQQVEKINDLLTKKVVGKTVQKGEMISSFLFGGSDIVMVFQRESNINILAQPNVHYPIRSQYAYSNIAKLKQI